MQLFFSVRSATFFLPLPLLLPSFCGRYEFVFVRVMMLCLFVWICVWVGVIVCVGVGRKPKSEGSEGRVCQQLLQVKRAGRQVNLSPCAYNDTICFCRGVCESRCVCVCMCFCPSLFVCVSPSVIVCLNVYLFVCVCLCVSISP